MFELLRSIYLEQAKIEEILQEEDAQVAFYEDFFKNEAYTSIKSILKADKLDLAVAIIMTEHPELDVDYVKQAILDNRTFFESKSKATLQSLTETLCNMQSAGYYRVVRDRFASGKKIELADILHQDGLIFILFNNLLDTFEVEPQKFVSFMDLFEKYPTDVAEALATVAALNSVKKEYDSYVRKFDEIGEEKGKKIRARKQDRVVNSLINYDWNVQSILKPARLAREYYERKRSEQKSKKKYNLKLREAYNELEREISQAINSGNEIKGIDKLLSRIDNEDIRKQALKVIYLHNKTLYEKANSEYQRLLANASSRYQVLLAKYGVSPEDYDVGTVTGNSIEDLEKMLNTLSALGIKTPSDILKFATCSNLETVSNYHSLIERGIITSELLLIHKDLLNPNSKAYESFMRNLALIREKKINPLSFRDSQEVLTTSNKKFSKSIETVFAYELHPQMRTGINYAFLAVDDLAASIDTLLELGLEGILEEDIEILNYAPHFNRLKLLKSLNMPVSTKEELLNVLTTDKFFVSDSEIESYIYNASTHKLPTRVTVLDEEKKKNPDISKLEEYTETSRTYNVGGVIFSKNKTARNLGMIVTAGKTSDRLLYGLAKDTTLTDEEFERVANAIVPIKATQLSKK